MCSGLRILRGDPATLDTRGRCLKVVKRATDVVNDPQGRRVLAVWVRCFMNRWSWATAGTDSFRGPGVGVSVSFVVG